MRIAWFRPSEPGRHGENDHLADVVLGLRRSHAITLVGADQAYDFVWQQARGAFDLCVYQLDNTPQHQFMWPYLVNYPGVLALQSATLHDARRARLVHEGRTGDYRIEIAFAGGPTHVTPPWHLARGQWPMLRIPVAASRLTAVADSSLARDIAALVPDAVVRTLTVGIEDRWRDGAKPEVRSGPLVVAAAEPTRREVVERAAARAGGGGLPIAVTDERSINTADVVVAVRWPLHGRPLVSALRAMAAAKPTVVAETYGTAGWPSLDPQTWRARDGGSGDKPAVVSLDPRDEEHSLVLALGRLAADAELRANLGRAARAWWTTHATLEHALDDWMQALADAAQRPAPPRPDGWPAHLDADGLGLTRRLLSASGLAFAPGN